MTVYPEAPGDTLIFENDRVRVWSMTLEPGQLFDFHQHHHDHVVLWPEAGTAQAQELGDPDWGLVQEARPGFVLYRTVGHRAPLSPHRAAVFGRHRSFFSVYLLDSWSDGGHTVVKWK